MNALAWIDRLLSKGQFKAFIPERKEPSARSHSPTSPLLPRLRISDLSLLDQRLKLERLALQRADALVRRDRRIRMLTWIFMLSSILVLLPEHLPFDGDVARLIAMRRVLIYKDNGTSETGLLGAGTLVTVMRVENGLVLAGMYIPGLGFRLFHLRSEDIVIQDRKINLARERPIDTVPHIPNQEFEKLN